MGGKQENLTATITFSLLFCGIKSVGVILIICKIETPEFINCSKFSKTLAQIVFGVQVPTNKMVRTLAGSETETPCTTSHLYLCNTNEFLLIITQHLIIKVIKFCPI